MDDRRIDRLNRGGSEPIERPVERVMLGHGRRMEIGKDAQRISVGNAFPQFSDRIAPLRPIHRVHQ